MAHFNILENRPIYPLKEVEEPNLLPDIFDYDQVLAGVAMVFENGNATACPQPGGYRNGSDVTVGLDYTNPNQVHDPINNPLACDPAASSGWSSNTFGGGMCKDIGFLFTSFDPGDLFEFDCDTDGGAGVTGGAMAGLVVTITWSTGCQTSGELQADPANPNRSFINL